VRHVSILQLNYKLVTENNIASFCLVNISENLLDGVFVNYGRPYFFVIFSTLLNMILQPIPRNGNPFL